MNSDIRKKMQRFIYALTKNAARESYADFLDELGITPEDYEKIKQELYEKLDVKPYT